MIPGYKVVRIIKPAFEHGEDEYYSAMLAVYPKLNHKNYWKGDSPSAQRFFIGFPSLRRDGWGPLTCFDKDSLIFARCFASGNSERNWDLQVFECEYIPSNTYGVWAPDFPKPEHGYSEGTVFCESIMIKEAIKNGTNLP